MRASKTRAKPETAQPGSVVRLRSGGPLMTVTLISPRKCSTKSIDFASCAWFNGSHKLTELEFPVAALEIISPDVAKLLADLDAEDD